jgi:hypothetical protein
MEQKFIKYMTKNKQIGGNQKYMIKCLRKNGTWIDVCEITRPSQGAAVAAIEPLKISISNLTANTTINMYTESLIKIMIKCIDENIDSRQLINIPLVSSQCGTLQGTIFFMPISRLEPKWFYVLQKSNFSKRILMYKYEYISEDTPKKQEVEDKQNFKKLFIEPIKYELNKIYDNIKNSNIYQKYTDEELADLHRFINDDKNYFID